MSDEWSKLSNLVGAEEATRLLEQRDRKQVRVDEDHGISPAQLREKVEALQEQVGAQQSWMLDLSALLDAALKRIEQLERAVLTQEPGVAVGHPCGPNCQVCFRGAFG